MASSTIAIIILFAIVYIALLFTPLGAGIVAITGCFALIAGFIFIMSCGITNEGWNLFWGCLWELFWICILIFVPSVANIMSTPHNKH